MTDIIIGDCRIEIPKLDDNSIDCIMTSPPYWGLRDYGHSDQLGLESTPEEYLENMLHVFDLVKPKLKDVGNCFVNLGDTYYGSWGNYGNRPELTGATHNQRDKNTDSFDRPGIGINVKPPTSNKHDIIKHKCLCMIPQRFAWGMIERGWILRNEIIWHKPNHMPESVKDRLTKSHEVVWHFVKQGKYYYDLDAIREPHKGSSIKRMSQDIENQTGSYRGDYGKGGYKTNGSMKAVCNEKGKNPGDVWQINTQPYREAHFAVFPLELVEKPILAGCPVGGRVLDMFGGSGTVAEYCRHNERECTIIELNEDYRQLIKNRSMAETPSLSNYKLNI